MKVSYSVILLVIGISIVTASQSILQKLIKTLPQSQQVIKSCTTAIDRSKAALPNYKNIVTTYANIWNDATFPADRSSIQWSGKYTYYALDSFIDSKWKRLNNLCLNCTLFGSADYLSDIAQGALGDCYFLSTATAFAELNSRFEKIFVNPQKNLAGLYAFNVFIRGIPQIVIVDDSIPVGENGKDPVFAGIGNDNSIWGPLLEKAWAKTNANYERIEGGNTNEALCFLQNIPATQMLLEQFNKATLWTKISVADSKNWIITLNTPQSRNQNQDLCKFNLACAHSYSLLSVKTVYNKDRSQQVNLFKIRNPWRKDKEFQGSYKDGSSLWLTEGADGKNYAEQAGLVIADDGVFYMTMDEVLITFVLLEIGEYQENFITSWYDKRNDLTSNANSPSLYKFTLTEATPMYIRAIAYPSRMYPISCKSGQAYLRLALEDASGKRISQIYTNEDSLQFISLVDTPLAAGNYTLKFYPEWTTNHVKDYGIIINAPKNIVITDSLNRTSRLTAHDISSKQLQSKVRATVQQGNNETKSTNQTKTILPDISKNESAYELTGNLDQDIVKIRNSISLNISNEENGLYLQGKQSSFSAGNDQCTVKNNNATGEDEISCGCILGPDTYPKECLLVLLTEVGEGYESSIQLSSSDL
ncbi:calpain family cysteine protease containing protein [Stylonychia lemnae]|uniref:Calpain family cysteine protease containing protein n=1 Tax=Stylonychia lemnae TaxID=5949 RepID=A0A078AKF8_STYLE|nr:calpain family cysteine protease containing protein [Stylonychia lemnae]|eukprot:CDW82699.1 calpain family cysteine protease containing protein [Stylonychia lemnae]